jgi:hypothetical protein
MRITIGESMKKIVLLISIVLVSILFNIVDLKADCSANIEEIKNNVKATYEATFDSDKGYYFYVKVFPIDERMYIKINGDGIEETKVSADAKDQVISVEKYYIYEEVEYTVNIYSNMEECKDELIETIKVVTPKYNQYRDSNVCELNKEYKLCQPFEDTSKISEDELEEKVKEYEEEKNKDTFEKLADVVKKYYIYVLVPIVLIGGIYTYKIIKITRKK